MNKKEYVGLDKWKVALDALEVVRMSKKHNLELYDLRIYHHHVQFYTSVLQRPIVHRCFQEAQLLTTTGMFGYFFRSLKKPSRIISLLVAIGLWYGLSHMVFEIEIRGEKEESQKLIEKTLQDMQYKVPFYASEPSVIKADLKKKLENEIAWLEVQKQGSKYIISYTPKEFVTTSELDHTELVALEDGVIAQFDIQHGNKEYSVNDFVHKGDVLVNNVLVDSKGKKEELYVKGRVLAYTWRDIEVTMDKGKTPKSIQFYQLLFEARRKVSQDFKQGDKIYKENILQFEEDMGKIKMVLHYTLLKDITTP